MIEEVDNLTERVEQWQKKCRSNEQIELTYDEGMTNDGGSR